MPNTSVDFPVVAYFSVEVGLDQAMPTYCGGLGVLAGDTVRAAADLGLPMVGVTLLHRKGYFRQHLDADGNQSAGEASWSPESLLQPMPNLAAVSIEGRRVLVRAWRYVVRGVSGHRIPVFLLDTFLPANSPWDQTLTDHLYGGDERYRLCQEMVLGVGGVAMLRALGYDRIRTYHMNEGHSALLGMALLEERTSNRGSGGASHEDVESVRRRCVFTTHTPVRSGHDQFPSDLAANVMGRDRLAALVATNGLSPDALSMTHLALSLSRYVNGVAMSHGETAGHMFPGYAVNSITNGVHGATWTSHPFADLYDRYIPSWRRDNLYLRYAVVIPLDDIWQAHQAAKLELIAEVERRTGRRLDAQALTIGFARRATPYKRHDLLFTDLERLREIAREAGPIQVVYAGKAHPRDEGGKAMIKRVFDAASRLQNAVTVVYLEDYDMALAGRLCAGVDLWLNTPQKPHEASGTSGMKAAFNGVPSLSILDGWWVEGHVEGVTGWAIGGNGLSESSPQQEVASLYDKLEGVVLPLFHSGPRSYAQVMRSCIAINASFFNTTRMVRQYVENAYFLRDALPSL